MANDIVYVDLIRGVKQDKLGWIIEKLTQAGIPNRQYGYSINGAVVQVEAGSLEGAMGVINNLVGEFIVGLQNTTITALDLPDDHIYFHQSRATKDSFNLTEPPVPALIDSGVPPKPIPAPPTMTVVPKTSGRTAPVNPGPHGKIPSMSRKEAEEMKRKTNPVLAESKPAIVVDDDDFDWDDVGPAKTTTVVSKDDWMARAKEALKWTSNVVMTGPSKQDWVETFEVSSSHMSTIGWHELVPADPDHVMVYASFKGGAVNYRYFPCTRASWIEMIEEAIKVSQGVQEASVGEVFSQLFRTPADEGKITCERYADDGVWEKVLPKSERKKERLKRHTSQ